MAVQVLEPFNSLRFYRIATPFHRDLRLLPAYDRKLNTVPDIDPYSVKTPLAASLALSSNVRTTGYPG